MKINYKLLKKFGACEDGINKFVNTFRELEIPKNVKEIIINGDDIDDAIWFIDKLKPKNCIVRFEESDDYWKTKEYDEQGNLVRYENSDGSWETKEYNEQGLEVRYEDSNGYWKTTEYNEQGNLVRHEDSNGIPKYDFTINFK